MGCDAYLKPDTTIEIFFRCYSCGTRITQGDKWDKLHNHDDCSKTEDGELKVNIDGDGYRER